MFYIENTGIIRITRGDSAEAPLFMNQGCELNPIRYELKDNDEVYFGVMEPNYPFEQAIIKKKYTKNDVNEYGDVVVKFSSEDTVNLIPGKYFYSIKLNKWDEEKQIYDIYTIVERTQFFIEE